jgi:hypothetical protein
MEKNDVASFMYYMWNSWNKTECEIVFANAPSHFWSKWIGYRQSNERYGAVEEFFANLSENNQDILVKRATCLYNRRRIINEK